ncbi:uncharacterized protein [Nicotiana sylvestris]|uniref:uncharacterized protein n=1 Tax=Nicotiana sylvestris TaxID=4096 RepID=UPI00388CBF1D
MYCNQLRGTGRNEELLMAYFGESLVEITSEWYMDKDISRWHIWDDLARDFVRQFQYNVYIAPDRNSLSNFKKKSSESFQKYAIKWREQAARVKPPMDETEMDEEVPNVTNNPLPAHNNGPVIGMICEDKEFDPALKAIIAIADVEKKPKMAANQAKDDKKNNPIPQSVKEVVETKTGAVLPKDAILYVPRAPRKERFVLSSPKRFKQNKVTLTVPRMYVPKGIYVAWGPVISPRLTKPVVISRASQKPMKNPTIVPQNYNKAVVMYKGKEIMGEVNETNPSEKYLNLEEVNNAKQKRFPLKKPVSAEEVEEFFRKMKTVDYDVIDQLRKSPSQVSLLSLLISSSEHQKVLIKTLNEAYVPVETTVEQLERMAERFFKVNRISFSQNDFPTEGATHNKALHLTIKCEGYYVKRVMLDDGSGVDICHLSTLQRMESGIERIRPNNVCVRAFDDVKRDTIWEIDLILTIGPVDFEVTFQVLDMDTSYNFLLERPWIHTVGAVHSTLHQMVKFEHKDQEIVVHGEDEQSIYKDTENFFGVGFQATEADVKWAKERKNDGWVLPQPVPHLTRTFVKPRYIEEEDEAFKAEEIEDICGAIRQMLYKAYMVQPSEGSSTVEEIEMYVDDMIIKSRTQDDHVQDLRKLFESIFIAQLTSTCDPIFKLLKKDAAIRWTDECQEAFDKIKEYLSNPPVLVPPEPGRPLFLYLIVLENYFGCVIR